MPLLVIVVTLATVVLAVAALACLFFAGMLIGFMTDAPAFVGYLLGAVFVVAPVYWVVTGDRSDSAALAKR